MESKRNLVSLVAFIALALLLTSIVSALNVQINGVEVSGATVGSTDTIAAQAGETIPVRIFFTSDTNLSDVRVKAWVSGDRDYAVSSDRFDLIAGLIYPKLMTVQMPSNIDPDEDLKIIVTVEDQTHGVLDGYTVSLKVQRDNYAVEALDISMDSKVKAGETIPVDIVLKNTGRHFAEDTFVRATIPTLGIERRVYFGDLAPVDQANPDKEDAVERRMLLSVPTSTPAGIYTIQFEVYNGDSSATVTKKIAVVGASGDSRIVSSTALKTFGVGEKASYTLTLVNSGEQVRIYDISFESPEGLSVSADESVIAVPAGSSKTVKVEASALKAGKYTFVANVESDGELVKKESFVAQVEGKGINNATNTTVVLTVVLAIVFIVLLVVLIVLLTRKPQKSEELGESYY